MKAYYNDNDPFCCEWLSNLMDAGLITPGVIDDRSIEDVSPDDLKGFARVHFFAGIAGWEYALQIAGWGDRPVWTGSCPCQPFSGAGQRKAHADRRHLWPAFFRLIAECRPAVVFGEQVASNLGREWLSGVRADLESVGYACGAADLPAAGVGAPHIRQRLWWDAWLADANGRNPGTEGLQRGREHGQQPEGGCTCVWLADAEFPAGRADGEERTAARPVVLRGRPEDAARARSGGEDGRVADAERPGPSAVQQPDRTPDEGRLFEPEGRGTDGGWPPGSIGYDSGHETGCAGTCGLAAFCCGMSVCAHPDRCDGQPGSCRLDDPASEGTGHGRQETQPGRDRAEDGHGTNGGWPPGSIGHEGGHARHCDGDCGRSDYCCRYSVCADPNRCDGQPGSCWLADSDSPGPTPVQRRIPEEVCGTGVCVGAPPGFECGGRVGGLADAERRPAERHRHEVAGTPSSDQSREEERERLRADARDGGDDAGGVGDAAGVGRRQGGQDDRRGTEGSGTQGREQRCGDGRDAGRLDDADRTGLEGRSEPIGERPCQQHPWQTGAFVLCADGKARRVKPSVHPLADGIPAKVGRLRAYGNAIVPQLAAAFIAAADEATAAN